MAKMFCDECGISTFRDAPPERAPDVERIYRLIAERADRKEILERFHEVFGDDCQLRAPTHEMAVADRIMAGSV
jgi:hypothetical protein